MQNSFKVGNERVLALIPARGGSKGVPRKNIRPLCGKPLIQYAIEVALGAKSTCKTLVSTDDEEIAQLAREAGAEVPFLRPEALAGDRVPDFPVVEHALKWVMDRGWCPEVVVFLRPTNIFRNSAQIDQAINKLLSDPTLDSVRAVSLSSYSPYWMKRIEGNKLVSFLPSEYEYAPRQILPKVFQGNGTIEVIRAKTILDKKSMYGDQIGFIEMDEIARQDIDTEIDFRISELLFPLWKDGRL